MSSSRLPDLLDHDGATHQPARWQIRTFLVFYRRICFYRNYTLIFDELKNFATQPSPLAFPVLFPGFGIA
jgi:hypothetical protein